MKTDYSLTLPHEATELARFPQYVGAWAIEDAFAVALTERIESMDILEHIRSASFESDTPSDNAATSYTVEDGVGVLELRGMVTKYGSSLSMFPGTLRAMRSIRQMRDDQTVGAVMLVIDSPGGTVSGTCDLADAVAELASVKPVTAYAEDLAASAAYWIASQASRVVANRSAKVGSIGTYAVISDKSAAAERAGVKVHVLKAGEHKGDFTPGTPVTDDQIANAQRTIDESNAVFLASVAAGRGMKPEAVRAIADGRIHSAASAQRVKLIDAVQTKEQAMSELRTLAARNFETQGATAMQTATENETPSAAADVPSTAQDTNAAPRASETTDTAKDSPGTAAATYAEIKAALPNASASFRETCLDRGDTLDQARAAYIADLEARSADAAAQAADTGSVDPLGDEGAGAKASAGMGDAISEFSRLIDEEAKSNGGDRAMAAITVNRKHPGLREQTLSESAA